MDKAPTVALASIRAIRSPHSSWSFAERLLVVFALALLAQTAHTQPALVSHWPEDGATVYQAPPDFRWPWQRGVAVWRLQLRRLGEQNWQEQTVTYNMASWPAALAAGTYEWRVGAQGAREPNGKPRQFTIAATARPFVMPAPKDQLRNAALRPRPRFALPEPSDPEEAKGLWNRVRKSVSKPSREVRTLDETDKVKDRGRYAKAMKEAKREGQRAAAELTEVALALRLRQDDELAAEGRQRLLDAADWDPQGSTGVDNISLVARDVVWGMALLYDAVHGQLKPDERAKIVDRILVRAKDIKRRYVDDGRMQRDPLSSHGWVNWGGAAAAVALLAGEGQEADAMFMELVPPFIASICPWGGEQGGFANGTTYGTYDIGALIVPFDIIGQAVGADLYTKAFLRNFGSFLTYFIPPGAPEAPFGDGAEIMNSALTAWVIRGLSQRVDSPLLRWSAGARDRSGFNGLARMLSSIGSPAGPVALPKGTPDSAVFDDIGWVAMHSSLEDPRRVSVYFKSSPFGSAAHGHADQNAIAVHAGGKALLKGSGYYDFFASKHADNWYQTTHAHNAITIDGGAGQKIRTKEASGALLYTKLATDHDIAIGDATVAYGGQLSIARRSVVLLKPDVVLVYDVLASDVARQWEWNFNADERMQGDARQVRVISGDQQVCIDVLHAPPIRFEQRTGFTDPPKADVKKSTRFPDQWHGTFTSTGRSREAAFLMALRVGCAGKPPVAQANGEGWTVSLEGNARRWKVGFSGKSVVVN